MTLAAAWRGQRLLLAALPLLLLLLLLSLLAASLTHAAPGMRRTGAALNLFSLDQQLQAEAVAEAMAAAAQQQHAAPSPATATSTSRNTVLSAGDAESLYFDNLSEAELAAHYSAPPSDSAAASIRQQIRRITRTLGTTASVDIVLVGFDGRGDGAVVVDPAELQRFVAQAGLAKPQTKFSIEAEDGSHELPLTATHAFRIRHAAPLLFSRLQSRLQEAVDLLIETNPHLVSLTDANRPERQQRGAKTKPPAIPSIQVPVDVMDAVLTQDFVAGARTPTVYLLNMAPIFLKDDTSVKRPTSGGGGEERVRLRYVYLQFPSSAPSNASHSSCPATHWVSRDHRLAWFDISAGPIAYGPASWGGGVVTEWTLPNVGRMLANQNRYARRSWQVARIPVLGVAAVAPDVPFVPATQLNTHFRHTLLAELAGLLSKASRTLLQPPVQRWNSKGALFAKTIKIHMVFVHERHYGESVAETEAQIAAQAGQEPLAREKRTGEHISTSTQRSGDRFDNSGEKAAWRQYPDSASVGSSSRSDGWSDWSAVERELLALALPDQSIEIHNHHMRFESCKQCVSAYTHSLRTHTTNIVADDSGAIVPQGAPGAALRTAVSHYLDASELKDWLEHFDTKHWNMREETTDDTAAEDRDVRVLRVFIYDLAAPGIVLLDRFHQSMAFGDMVIAVQSRVAEATVDYSCDGRMLTFDPRDSSRAVLGSILTAGWAIVPSYQSWAPHLNDTENDFLLTLGHTPFGYFSAERSLHFALKDAAATHMLMSHLHSSVQQIAALFPPSTDRTPLSAPPDALVDSLLYASPTVDFLRRWNVLSFKLAKALHWVGLHQLDQAYIYVSAIRRDANQLRKLAQAELDTLRVTLACGSAASGADASWFGDSHLLFFLLLEGAFLCCIVCFIAWASRQPRAAQAILARLVPAALHAQLGINNKAKDF